MSLFAAIWPGANENANGAEAYSQIGSSALKPMYCSGGFSLVGAAVVWVAIGAIVLPSSRSRPPGTTSAPAEIALRPGEHLAR